mmetsp:Transcript_10243/g.62596  ORF Transcript_10243/g.62596 Transcript_10243/m.62596 type:complete len:85 (-) Transcript_10243:67-321(-)
MEPFSGGDERSEPFGRVGVDEAAWRMRRVDTAKKRRAQHEMAAKGKVQVVGPPPDWVRMQAACDGDAKKYGTRLTSTWRTVRCE